MKNNTIININEIRDVFKEYCGEEDIQFSEENFKRFLDFLEIDFYDWIKENFEQFIVDDEDEEIVL
jgi:hypothetical protein